MNDAVNHDLATATSLLFVPADRPDRLRKALASGADLVIADLEDAVAPAQKVAARQSLLACLDESATVRLLVRINGVDSPWHDDDLLACRHPQVMAVVLPKAETSEQVAAAAAGSGKAVLPIIETAMAVAAMSAIAEAAASKRLIFGKLDLALDLGLTLDTADSDELALLPYRCGLVLASRLAGLPPPVEGVYTDIGDEAGLTRYARRARGHGFGAMLLIHPRQTLAVHRAFASSAAELAWAESVVEAATAAGGQALQVAGQMVDAPVIARARVLLAQAGRA